jgi:hypothetical protein
VTEKFDVLSRWTGKVQFTAEIECPLDAHPKLKLGLAVIWGHKNGANLVGARLDRARLVGANLVGANLVGASLDRARLVGANLVGANLDGARLVGANLDGANLDGARLVGARLVGANLDGASLDGARLDGASLDGASLVGARLDGANLDGARLVGARLVGALVRNRSLKEVKIAKLIARMTRNDGYEFILWLLQDGSALIKAGCQTNDIEGYAKHVAEQYPDTDKARETLAILDYFKERLKAIVEAESGQ